MADSPSFEPLVIIGAARSGTNLLRDLLTSVPGLETWPCDEINLTWRHGNARHPDDALSEAHARPEVSAYIRRSFQKLADRSGAAVVVEKTCANSMRVPFIAKILPEARFVFIVRDGADAIASAEKRWRASFDLAYTLRKVRFVPPGDLPYYARRFLQNRIFRLRDPSGRLASWGPRPPEWDDLDASADSWDYSAVQWRESVDRASTALADLDGRRVHRLRYEDLVTQPADELASLWSGLSLEEEAEPDWSELVAGVSQGSLGKGWDSIPAPVLARIKPVVQATLLRHGYEWRAH